MLEFLEKHFAVNDGIASAIRGLCGDQLRDVQSKGDTYGEENNQRQKISSAAQAKPQIPIWRLRNLLLFRIAPSFKMPGTILFTAVGSCQTGRMRPGARGRCSGAGTRRIIFRVYMVDLFCLAIKDVFIRTDYSLNRFERDLPGCAWENQTNARWNWRMKLFMVGWSMRKRSAFHLIPF